VDQLKDDFLANVSHELRTPLHGIIGITQSLIDGVAGKPNEKMWDNFSIIISSGKRLASLVNDLLDFSKLKKHELELNIKPVDIRILTNILLKLSKPLIYGKELTLKNEIEENIPPVAGDENRLYQIMHNLIGNAIKFTESGSVSVSAEYKDSMVYISVADTGIGIAKDKTPDIFKSFEQIEASVEREYGGTGLGLSITKQLVELHGGEISVDSKVGQGSTFTFSISASSDKPESAKNQKSIVKITEKRQRIKTEEIQFETPIAQKYSILIVDDEPVNQQVLKN